MGDIIFWVITPPVTLAFAGCFLVAGGLTAESLRRRKPEAAVTFVVATGLYGWFVVEFVRAMLRIAL